MPEAEICAGGKLQEGALIPLDEQVFVQRAADLWPLIRWERGERAPYGAPCSLLVFPSASYV